MFSKSLVLGPSAFELPGSLGMGPGICILAIFQLVTLCIKIYESLNCQETPCRFLSGKSYLILYLLFFSLTKDRVFHVLQHIAFIIFIEQIVSEPTFKNPHNFTCYTRKVENKREKEKTWLGIRSYWLHKYPSFCSRTELGR